MTQELPLAILAVVQFAHALSFGLTQVGVMLLGVVISLPLWAAVAVAVILILR